jgi:hypothetical protein
MRLSKEIMLKRQELRMFPGHHVAVSEDIQGNGGLEGDFRCLRCGAPMHLTIDGAGWHLHLGIEVE